MARYGYSSPNYHGLFALGAHSPQTKSIFLNFHNLNSLNKSVTDPYFDPDYNLLARLEIGHAWEDISPGSNS